MARAIRYLCEILSGAEGDVPLAYLQALVATGRPVRAFPIGGAVYGCDDRWSQVAWAFAAPMAHRFVNVVCAPLCRAVQGPSPAGTAFASYFTLGAAGANIAIVAPTPNSPPQTIEAIRLEARILTNYDRVIVSAAAADRVDHLGDLVDHVGGRRDRVVHVPAEPAALATLLDAGGW